jgi:hypothetical protein
MPSVSHKSEYKLASARHKYQCFKWNRAFCGFKKTKRFNQSVQEEWWNPQNRIYDELKELIERVEGKIEAEKGEVIKAGEAGDADLLVFSSTRPANARHNEAISEYREVRCIFVLFGKYIHWIRNACDMFQFDFFELDGFSHWVLTYVEMA